MTSAIQRIRFKACITGAGPVVERGELVVEGGVIQNILETPSKANGPEVLDLSDHLLLPGFVNAHCHLALSALKGKLSRRQRFTDWVRDLIAANAEISEQNRITAFHTEAREMLQSGVTALGDFSSHPDLLSESARLPFRQVVFLETLAFKSHRVEETIKRVRSILDAHDQRNGLLRLGVAPHAPYSVSPRLFQELKRLAAEHAAPFSCHVAEFDEETRFLKEGGGELEEFLRERGVFDADWQPPGKTPLRYLDDLEVLQEMATVHLNEVDGDLDLLASSGVHAVFCPGSTKWFGRTRCMPVRGLIDRGVSVGLGTDSLASNASLNFLREIKLAEEMLPDVSRGEILKMATQGGAKALGLNAGEIAPGFAADVIGFRIEKPPAAWVDVPFAPERQCVDFVMVNGKPVFSSSLQ